MTSTTTSQGESRTPTYIAYNVVDGKAEATKSRWHRIGAVFAHEDGLGGTLILESLPIAFDGRIVLRVPKVEQAESSK